MRKGRRVNQYLKFLNEVTYYVIYSIKEHDLLFKQIICRHISYFVQDMTGKEDSYRAAAIRALCTITDPVISRYNNSYRAVAIIAVCTITDPVMLQVQLMNQS